MAQTALVILPVNNGDNIPGSGSCDRILTPLPNPSAPPAKVAPLPSPPPSAGGTNHTLRRRRISRADHAAALLKSSPCTLPHLQRTHAHILRSGLHHNPSLAALLIPLYAALSSPSAALAVLSHSSSTSLPLLNAAVRALSKPSPSAALRLYRRMTLLPVPPDNFTFPFLLNSAAALSSLPAGAEIHSRLLRSGFLPYLPVANALVDMYGKCGDFPSSRQVFDEMPVRDLISYNAVIGAHARLGVDIPSARALFDAMPERNVISYNGMIVGYVNAGELLSARAVFDAMPARNLVSYTVMVIGYSKRGMMDAARGLFDEMPCRNLVSWTVMITGYAQSGRPEEALAVFHEMERAGTEPDAAAMVGVISACGQLGSVEMANWAGAYVDRKGIERNERVLTALVDMHAKCGNLEEACCLFEEIPSRDVFCYAALINGLASHDGLRALGVFKRMREEDVKPDHITFVGVLNACSHAGLVDEGLEFWQSMDRDYGIKHGPDHYACIVDMLGRAGRLGEAHELVKTMPMGPHAGALGALLASCRSYANVEIAESVASDLFELEPENTGNYILLSGIYASKGQWADAARVRKMIKEIRIKKFPGSSWVGHAQGA